MTDGIPLPPITEENRLTQLLLAGWKSMDPIKRAYYVMQLRLLHHRASLEGNEKQGRVLAKKKNGTWKSLVTRACEHNPPGTNEGTDREIHRKSSWLGAIPTVQVCFNFLA